ncbi:MAG: protein phosphatase 2C domain-containing protein, partial [Leptodesmis sp.]
ANQAIYNVNQQNARSGSGRMGTTLVIVLIHDTQVAVAHVGDSRLYRYTRKRGLEQVTVDHEVGQREIQRGVDPEIAYSRPDAYQLTQALGPRDGNFVRPDVQFFELNEDMLLLLCSDGLSDNDLLEKHWETHVQPLLSSQTNLDKGVSELIELANRYNGHDNITAIAIRAKVRPSLDHLK